MTELVLIRHGETDYNRELRFQGHSDVPLNAAGLAQAQRAANALKNQPISHLFTSDLQRARQTAQVIADAFSSPPQKGIEINPAWRERSFGQIDGLSVPDIQQRYPEAWASWMQFGADDSIAGIESTRSLHTRVMAALHSLAQSACNSTMLVVTHGGVLDVIYRQAQGLPLAGPRQCEIPNAGINRLALHHDAAGNLHLVILEWAQAAHLQDLPPQAVYSLHPGAVNTDQVPLPTPVSATASG